MSDEHKLIETPEAVKNIFESEEKMKQFREEMAKRYNDYRKTINFMAADAPIQTLCLPKPIENILIREGCLRIYDVIDLDLTKIEGLGPVRIRNLTSSLDQFFSML